MKTSLSVVMPLFNAQSAVGRTIEDLLEILPELTPRFEVVLVDDGSTDATIEAAHEWSLHFPQVQLIVHPTRLGPQEALRSAMRYAHGDLLLGCRDAGRFDPHEIGKLWNRRTADGAVFGLLGEHGPLGSIPAPPVRAAAAGRYDAAADRQMPEMLLVPRRLLVGWSQAFDQPIMSFLRARGFPLRGIEIRGPAPQVRRGRADAAQSVDGIRRRLSTSRSPVSAGGVPKPAAMLGTGAAPTRRRPASPTEAAATTPAGAKRPNMLLAKLKALALGE